MNTGEWRHHVETMCADGWKFGPHITQKVIQELEFLVASDQVTDFTVADVLCHVGVKGPEAETVAPGIRATIKLSA